MMMMMMMTRTMLTTTTTTTTTMILNHIKLIMKFLRVLFCVHSKVYFKNNVGFFNQNWI